MNSIIWDQEKNEKLIFERNISFDEISQMIMDGKYMDIIENPVREGQMYFVMEIQDYTWIVPFIIDEDDNIVLKTAYQSRKYHKKYRGK
ncbi:toxin [Marispirochaeta sp.]|uniref:toxin n=1 Tax=Marispirochaeta sp. TaxID=2038653 RepID=UPI0029C7FECE|nr:toxin [Marispirochaeta sp.]